MRLGDILEIVGAAGLADWIADRPAPAGTPTVGRPIGVGFGRPFAGSQREPRADQDVAAGEQQR